MSVGALATTTITVRLGRGAAAFEQSLEVMLAAVARSVVESAKAGIEGRIERYHQARRRPPPLAETSTARETVPAVLAVNQWSAGEPAPVRAGAAVAARARQATWAQRVLPVEAPVGWGAVPAAPAWPTGYGDDLTPVAPEFSERQVADYLLSQTAFNLHWIPVVWGAGDLQHFSGTHSQLTSYRGDLQAAQVGMDLYTGEHALVGVSYMRSWGKADYTAEGFDGVMDNHLDTAYQYLYWQPHARLSVWGISGIGFGRVDVTEVGRTHDAAASFYMFAGGLRTVLSQRGTTEVGLRADAFSAALWTRATADIRRVQGDARRARAMLELVHDMPLGVGRSLNVQVEAGVRLDDDDAGHGAGGETGVRFGFLDAGKRPGRSAGRALVVHEHDFRDWGAGVQVSWDPELKGRGLQLSLSSAQGQHAGGRTTLWHDANVLTHPRDIGAGGLDTPTRTDSEVAYGLTAFGGLLTPYSQLQLAGYGRALSVGTTWHARPAGCHCGLAWKRRGRHTRSAGHPRRPCWYT